jgi:oligoendopeptidase F
MQYKQNPSKAIENYMNALSLGGTRTLPELYEAAGIRFDFSPEHIRELTDFVTEEMKKF